VKITIGAIWYRFECVIKELRDRITHWTQQIQRQPNSAKAYIQRGMARFMAAEIEGAIADYAY
jgi:hypothetical protein